MAGRLIQTLEDAWWKEGEVAACIDGLVSKGFNPADMRFYGEIEFVECGAKPLAILSGLPASCIASYMHKVLEPSGLFVLDSAESLPSTSGSSKLHAGILAADLSTANFDLSGSIYVCNPANPLYTRVHEVLAKKGNVSEVEMAAVLDYPWALPEEGIGEGDYVEVGYVDKNTKTLLMSYGVSRREFDNTKEKIKSHFTRYVALTRGIFDLVIVCRTT